MTVVIVVVIVGMIAGAAATVVAWRWAADPTDPHLEDRTVRRFVGAHRLIGRYLRRHHPRPSTTAAAAMGTGAVTVMIGAALAGAILVMIRTRTGLARADTPFAEWAAEHATDASTEVNRAISRLGGTDIVVIAALAVTAAALVRDRRWAIPAFVVATVGGQFLLSNGIKYAVDRARPAIAPLTGFSGTSFPSGHAVAAATTWMCVAFLLGRRRGRSERSVLFGLAVGLAVMVAATRVTLGVHWTTDVLAGLLIGWAWFALCAILFGGRLLEPGEPIEVAEEAAESPAAAP